jgi:hypothetical protein
MLEIEKTRSEHRIVRLKRMINESEETLAQKRGESSTGNQESYDKELSTTTPITCILWHTPSPIVIHTLLK